MKCRINTWADIQQVLALGCDVYGRRSGGNWVGWQRFISFPLSYIITDVLGNFEYQTK